MLQFTAKVSLLTVSSTAIASTILCVLVTGASSSDASPNPQSAGLLPWPIYGPISNMAPKAPYSMPEKRQMRNALVRFGRSAGMRNALVRFGKRTPLTYSELAMEMKRNDAPQPFVRFGRSGPNTWEANRKPSSVSSSGSDAGGRLSTFDQMFDATDDTGSRF